MSNHQPIEDENDRTDIEDVQREIAQTHKGETSTTQLPASTTLNLLLKSNLESIDQTHEVRGYDFNQGVNHSALLSQYLNMGFQATNFGLACQEVMRMLKWRLSDEPILENEDDRFRDEETRKNTKCTIFLGYTSNMISAGTREIIRFLAQHHLVQVLCTTTGGIEEDFIKCMHKTYVGRFDVSGEWLRRNGINRIGNLFSPNDNYCTFEDWLMPILDAMLEEQREHGVIWTPSRFIHRLGKEINNEDSVYYWCYRNNIPVFCPAITDGAIGDVIFLHSYKNPGLIIDIAGDIRRLNEIAVFQKKTGVIILGGGVVKHHILNANLMRNGADYSVFINTGNEYDGSDSGARPEEAKSWGKLKLDCNAVKIHADATLIFPLLVSQTFAPYHFEKKDE